MGPDPREMGKKVVSQTFHVTIALSICSKSTSIHKNALCKF